MAEAAGDGLVRIQPGRPLTVGQVVALAVRDDPDLVAARAQRGVAAAQLFSAGLLPDPQFAGALLPLVAGPGSTFAWTAALNEDAKALVTLSDRRRIARTGADQVDAQLLWQEWQVAGEARALAVDLIEGERALHMLNQAYALFDARSRRLQHALARGDLTLTATAPDAAALQSARAQVDALEQRQLQRRHQLNALLGLAPDAAVPLVAEPDLPAFDPQAALAMLPQIEARRPDLVALRLGYRAQDQRLRLAILSQFPALVLGVSGGSDNSNVRNIGPQFSANLPLFDRNRGAIAAERATRDQLRAEYQARLDAADAQVRALVREMQLQAAQLARVRQDLPGVEAAAERAERAFASADIDEQAYVDLVSARLAKAQEIISLEQALMDQEIAVGALVGAGLPEAALAAPGAAT